MSCPNCGRPNEPDARFCSGCGTELETPATREKRKLVTVVFCDLTGSTSLGERLDSESLRKIMVRYYAVMRTALEAHGGTVEKFIGDAVMAVFGVPVIHEDDALRAVRAAWAMADALGELNEELEQRWGERLLTRTGVNSGEVVTADDAAGDSLAVGDAVNVAARLEQAAGPGEILIGEITHRLIGEAVEAEPVEPLELKGKSEPVAAFRLVEVRAGEAPREGGLSAPLIGRETELGELQAAFEAARAESRCALALLSGEPGVGKSRLGSEFCAGLGDRARVLFGRCLPYGKGITYWPLAEVVKSAAAIEDEDSPERAGARIAELVASPEGELIARRLASAIGISDAPAEREDIFRAFRGLLESLATQKSVVVVFDDIQWAEETFLELISYLARNAAAPLLLLCTARPELAETHPGFGQDLDPEPLVIRLSPLGEANSQELIESLLGVRSPRLAERIAAAARGNPLFVEEMLRTMVDDGQLVREADGWRAVGKLTEVEVPATIQALLAARLERLRLSEREVIERASVIGEEFWRGAVRELSAEAERGEVGERLKELVARELLQSGGTPFLGEEPYRFSHLLVREVAYSGLLKELRAEFHELFADWLQNRAGERAGEYSEIIGYHLESAYRYRAELGPIDERAEELAARAGELLGAAGVRAYGRGDSAAAVELLERSTALLAPGVRARPKLLHTLAWALDVSGKVDRALEAAERAVSEAGAVGDEKMELLARLFAALMRERSGQGDETEEKRRLMEDSDSLFDATGDAEAVQLIQTYRLDEDVSIGAFRVASGRFERDLDSRSSIALSSPGFLANYATSLVEGPVPTGEAIRRLEALGSNPDRDLTLAARAEIDAVGLAPLEAMRGDCDRARRLYIGAAALFSEFNQLRLAHSIAGAIGGPIEMMAGDLDAAERALRNGAQGLRDQGHSGYPLPGALADLAQVLYAKGHYEAAEAIARESRDAAELSANTWETDRWKLVQAKLLALRGEHDEAESLARDAVAVAVDCDALNHHAAALLDLARILWIADRGDQTSAAAKEALSLYQAKANLAGVRWAREFLDGVAPGV